MNPFPSGNNAFMERKKILPVDYRESRGEYLMGSFSEFFYFTIRFSEDDILEIEKQDRENLMYLARIVTLYNRKMSLCLAGSSTEILPLMKDDKKRTLTLTAIEDLMKEYNISGIDLDWEFPRNDEEKQLHLDLMKDLKQITDRQEKTLSMAVSRHRLLPAETYDIPDSINLMAYDFYGRHSTWEGTLEALEYMLTRYKIPPEKIVMGLPFYGRIFDGFSPEYWKKSQSYREIVRDYTPSPWQDEAGGFYFNGPETIARKMQLASDHNIEGVFIWEIGQDLAGTASLSRIILDYNG